VASALLLRNSPAGVSVPRERPTRHVHRKAEMTNNRFEDAAKGAETVASALQRFVMPVFLKHEDTGDAEQYGTGFYVSAPPDTFFVSAAHVLDRIGGPKPPCVFASDRILRKLEGDLQTTPIPEDGDRLNDHLDVGVLRMTGPGLPPYGALGKEAFPFDRLSQSKPAARRRYLMIGYPWRKGGVNLSKLVQESAYWPIATRAILGSECKDKKFHPDARPDGRKITPHALDGMSGSPLFSLIDHRVEIAGVFVTHRTFSSILLCTVSAVVRELIVTLRSRR
jgi:hypothetical protein